MYWVEKPGKDVSLCNWMPLKLMHSILQNLSVRVNKGIPLPNEWEPRYGTVCCEFKDIRF